MFGILDEHIREPGPVEHAADRHVYPWRAEAVRAIWRSPCTGWWATTRRARSCSPTSSPRSANAWRAKTLRCNRSRTPWAEWSQRCAALATHPAVLESRDFWLENRDESRPASRPIGGLRNHRGRRPGETVVDADRRETAEIDDARRRLRLPIDEILLAALSRTIAATFGDGDVAVDLADRAVGSQARCRPAPDGRLVHDRLPGSAHLHEGSRAQRGQLLDDVHDTLNAVPHYGIGYGLLRYLYAPTARLLGAARPRRHLLLLRGHDSGAAIRRPTMLPCSSTPTPRCRCARRSRAGPRH